jgi:hypothetical protein
MFDGRVTVVYINPGQWAATDTLDRLEYERVAAERGIELREGGDSEILITSEGGMAPNLVPVDYRGVVACPRPPWEHALRDGLGIEDSCFGKG